MESGFGGILFIGLIIFGVSYLFSVINILREYERAVIFRLGKLYPNPKGPGVILVFRTFDKMVRVSLRQEAMEVPAHFFFQAEDGIRDLTVTGVQTCALPI